MSGVPADAAVPAAAQAQAYRGAWLRGSGRTLRRLGPPVLLTVAAIATWELAVRAFDVPKDVVPKPSTVGSSLSDHRGLVWRSTKVTVVEILYGFGLAVGIGVALALLLGRFRLVDRAVYPLVVVFQNVPKVAIAPLLILWFGFGMAPKAILIAVIAFFPITVTMRTGLASVHPDLVLLLRSVGASRTEILLRVQIPSSIPFLFAGLHVAITLSVIGAIVAEFAGAARGLGYLIQFASTQLDTPLVFAGILVISIVGIVLYYAVSLAELALARRFPRHEGAAAA